MTLDPTMREMAQAAEFLHKHFGSAVSPEHVAELAFVFQQMRAKERAYAVEGLAKWNSAAAEYIKRGGHLP